MVTFRFLRNVPATLIPSVVVPLTSMPSKPLESVCRFVRFKVAMPVALIPSPAAAPITCNAFLYNTLGPSGLQGITSVTVATTFADLPFRAVDNKREAQRYTIGAEGDLGLFGKAAPWDIYAQYGRVDTREQLRNIQNIARLRDATNVAFAQAGNPGGFAVGSIQCTINLDVSTTNDDRNCVPLNRLGLGVANPAAIRGNVR